MRTLFLLILLAMSFQFNAQTDSASIIAEQKSTTVLQIGQLVPDFTLKTIDKTEFKMSSFKGKTVVLNFCALSCPLCMKELPELEKKIWAKYKDHDNFVLLCIGREESEEKLLALKNKNGYSFPMASDIKREVYSIFGTKYIPRNVIINKYGTLIFTEVGYNEEKFEKLCMSIDKELLK